MRRALCSMDPDMVPHYSASCVCVGGRGPGGGGRQDGQAEGLCVAQDGRVRPGKAAAQAGRPDGEGPAPAGGGLTPSTFFIMT